MNHCARTYAYPDGKPWSSAVIHADAESLLSRPEDVFIFGLFFGRSKAVEPWLIHAFLCLSRYFDKRCFMNREPPGPFFRSASRLLRQLLLGGIGAMLAVTAWAADPTNGKAVYQQNCQACHQPGGAGIKGAFPPLADNPNIAGNPEYLAEVIIKGVSGPLEVNGDHYSGHMPAMAHIDNQKIVDLVAYILSDLNGEDGPISEASVQALR